KVDLGCNLRNVQLLIPLLKLLDRLSTWFTRTVRDRLRCHRSPLVLAPLFHLPRLAEIASHLPLKTALDLHRLPCAAFGVPQARRQRQIAWPRGHLAEALGETLRRTDDAEFLRIPTRAPVGPNQGEAETARVFARRRSDFVD